MSSLGHVRRCSHKNDLCTCPSIQRQRFWTRFDIVQSDLCIRATASSQCPEISPSVPTLTTTLPTLGAQDNRMYLVFTMHHLFPVCTTFVRGLNKIPPRAITSILFFTSTWQCSPCLGPTNRCWTFSRWWIYSVSDGSGSWEVTSVTRLVLEYDLWKEDN